MQPTLVVPMNAVVKTPAAAGDERETISHMPGTSDSGTGRKRTRQLPFSLAIFLSAFLLFQVQLLLGKELLPLFGGAPAVWTACVLVFQVLFLAGYGYSHGLAAWLPVRRQVLVHNSLLALSAVYLAALGAIQSTPIGIGATLRPQPGANPVWTIMVLLICAVGLPYFLLSATSPLMQHWYVQRGETRSAYRLYALSNVGSLLGLLSYPLFVEPHFGLHVQAWAWTTGYALFLICYFFNARNASRAAFAIAPKQAALADSHPRAAFPEWSLRLFWAALGACGSVLLLATTNLVCQDIAVSPFLWVLELSLYLFSFVVSFENDRWYRREIFYPAFALTVGLVIIVSLPNAAYSFLVQLAAYSAALFAGCMICQGEAVRTRPKARSLTIFYFCIAGGGALGGIIVSLIAPWMFVNYWEYPLGVLGCIAVLLFVSARERSSWWYSGRPSLAIAILSGVVLMGPVLLAPLWSEGTRLPAWASIGAAAVLGCAALFMYALERRRPNTWCAPILVRSASRIALALLTLGLLIPEKAALYHVVGSSRDFYGVLSVVRVSDGNYLALRDGNVVHGFQYEDKQRARVATGYYGSASGVNIVIRNWPYHPMRVGLVGMGAGTLAALGHPGDVFRFYEIDPDVYKLSTGRHPYFTFLKDSSARIEVVVGDARLSLENEADRGDVEKFDVLVLDAFSSDAIPMHLLTREAFSVYEEHLRGPASVIAVHISNQTLDLRPVLAGIDREFGFHALRVYAPLSTGPFSQSDWILLSRDPASLAGMEMAQHSEPFPGETQPIFWTDDYCNLFGVIRWHEPQ